MPHQATTTGKRDLTPLFPEELTGVVTALGAPAFRGKQLFSWIHRRLATDFAAMTDLPAELRQALTDGFTLTTLRQVRTADSPDGTVKYVFKLADDEAIETVYIPEPTRGTVCVSTQVGCPYGCIFCATGQRGFTRNLTAGEIVEQVYRIQATLPEGKRITNVVYMGMGEPLGNYDEVLRSVRLLIHPQGLNIGQRHLTISTVGLVPGMERLSKEGLQINLAISLHAPTQEGRRRLLPIAKKYELDEVIASARHYVQRTGRKVTFEYTVVPGHNDSAADADALARLARHLQCLVNVIPLNSTEGLPSGMRLSREELIAHAEAFTALLRERHLEVALRRSRGQEVTGACGQLSGDVRAEEAPPLRRAAGHAPRRRKAR